MQKDLPKDLDQQTPRRPRRLPSERRLTATQGQVSTSLTSKGCCMQSAAVPVHLCDLLSAASCNLCDEHAWTREEQ